MFTLAVSIVIAACPAPPAVRFTCVVDGDTVWINREKIRLAAIDAPEITGKCEEERALARRSKARLMQLLQSGDIRIDRDGKDRYGRTLARLYLFVGGNKKVSIGDVLVREGLAQPWPRRRAWCPR